jgi:hypothetical protein
VAVTDHFLLAGVPFGTEGMIGWPADGNNVSIRGVFSSGNENSAKVQMEGNRPGAKF